MTNWITSVLRLLSHTRPQSTWAWTDRQAAYDLWDSYYANTTYETLANGGQREAINSGLGNAQAADLAGLYNPCAAVVDLYLHTFNGAFGDEITIERTDAAQQVLVTAIEHIWTWSNLTIEKQPLCRFAATHGCVGLRIVARNDADATRRRVYIKPEHPRVIRDVELDDRGNVAAIQLEYEVTHGLAEDAETITVREELTKESIATWRVNGAALIPYDLQARQAHGPLSSYANILGVVPYVLLRHEHVGDTWGRNAFYRARSPIDRLNALMSHIDVQIHRHVKAKWFIAASGAAPTEIDLSDLSVAYVDTRGSTTPPVMESMVAPLDLAGAIKQAHLQIELIEDMLPELKATGGKFLSNQSGETIAELRKPAEDKLSLARANYEDALVRAQQIAVSWMILLGLADIGTGIGTRAAADAAYQGGFENHRFNKRPLLSGDTPAPKPQQQGSTAEEEPAQEARAV